MSHPLISVIIPVYNRATSISAAVHSALDQSVRDLEILIVDDGSTDSTRDVVRAIDDPRVRLVVREQNGGASAARNTGIRSARGAFIAFLDSDDIWLAGKLEHQLAALQASRAGVDVSCTGVELHLLDLGVQRIQYLEDSDDWARQLAMSCYLSPGTTQLSRREVFERIGLLDETLPRFEDWDWLLRYTRTGAIAPVRAPLARVYNRRAGHGDAAARSAKLFLAKHAAVFGALAPADRRVVFAALWLQVTSTYAFEGRFLEAIPSIIAAMRHRPINTLSHLITRGGGFVTRSLTAGQ